MGRYVHVARIAPNVPTDMMKPLVTARILGPEASGRVSYVHVCLGGGKGILLRPHVRNMGPSGYAPMAQKKVAMYLMLAVVAVTRIM